MLKNIDFAFILLHISNLVTVVMAFAIFKIKSRSQLKHIFISLILLLLIWNVSTLLEEYIRNMFGYTNMVLINICYFSICFLPISIMLFGITYARTHIRLSWKHLFLLLIIPTVSTVLIWSNNIHKLFFVKYSIYSTEAVYGSYFFIHSIYSYLCIFIGLSFLVIFSIKNSGFFSRQSFLLIAGISVPVVINIIFTFNIGNLPFVSNSIAFTFSACCFMVALFRYDFLNIAPIAIKTVVDRISDGFLVIDTDNKIIDYNKTLKDLFGNIVNIRRKDNLLKVLELLGSYNQEIFGEFLVRTSASKKSLLFEHHFKEKNFDKYFAVEITPIISKDNQLGTIIILKDISEFKENLRTIKLQQEQIVEQDRLVSLGTLMGGISHNLKTPIMSMGGCLIALEDLVDEYDNSIDNAIVNDNDHHEIAAEMRQNLKNIKDHLSYTSNALTAIKNQISSTDCRNDTCFTLEEVILNIEFLMKFEIQNNFCELIINSKTDLNQLIKGDIGTLVQIINNLISNSIQSYRKGTDIENTINPSRKIVFTVYEMERNAVFKVEDFGYGISDSIKDKLFKEMVTTKGKEGSGIGLYLSHTKVKVAFKGDMWFESIEGKGTTFFVEIPFAF